MTVIIWRFGGTLMGLAVVLLIMGQASSPLAQEPETKRQAPAPKAQTRPHGQRVKVDPAAIRVEDGDGVDIHWNASDTEIVRILGIDTPEVRRLEHNLPYDQPFGPEAKAFAKGAFAAATDVELLRSATLDPYGRTLAYLFINGRNYSAMVIRARFSGETVSHYGDNGLPKEAAEVTSAAKEAGASLLPFEPPHQYRLRMQPLPPGLRRESNSRPTEPISIKWGPNMAIVGLQGAKHEKDCQDRRRGPEPCWTIAPIAV